ncbi:7TM diverse intracellular signaling domain-containing protein [Thalassolituus sp. LLYu03]|uniref:hybrid sensor histidine kinase/response regulator n=1 Tax=Thalassolituus sp. LLYu03 TaxID=3421656 RepID=UPI003D27EF71
MRSERGCLILLLCFLLQGLPALAAEPLLLSDMSSGAPVGRHLQIWHETTPLAEGDFPPADAVWETSLVDVPNFGLADHPVWFRLTVHAERDMRDLLAVIGLPLLDRVQMFTFFNGQPLAATEFGDHLPYSHRPIDQREFVVPLGHTEPGDYQLVFRVTAGGSLQFPLALWHSADYQHKATNDYILLGLYVGFIASVALYNAFIYATTRERYALAFVGHILGYLGFLVALTGIGFQYLWPDNLWIQERSTTVFTSIAALFASLFARDFLELDKRKSKVLLHLNTLTLLIGSAIMFASLFMHYQTSVSVAISGTLLLCAVTLVIGLAAIERDAPSSLLYIAGWIGLLIGVILHSLAKKGAIPVTGMTANAAHIGSVWMVTMHSLGIALRFHEARREYHKTEQRMLEAQRDSLKARYLVQEAEIRRKRTEAENEAKSAFLATMSHEIRTPLNGVLGMVQLLGSTRLDPQQKRWLDTISSSGESLLTIVNDILDLSKMSSGHLQLDIQETDLHRVVHECLRLYASTAERKGLRLIADFHPPLHTRVRTDPTRLRQILSNLLSNALKFTERGFVRVSVDTRDGQLLFSVKDTGIGIPEAFRDRVFSHFSQADASTSRMYGGTGLGLSICRQLSELLGGRIEFQSEEGVGTEFTVTLPGCEPSAPLRLPEPGTFAVHLSNDEETRVVSDFLTGLGYRAVSAPPTNEPAEHAAEPLSVVITDQTDGRHDPATQVIALVDDPLQTLPVQQQLLRPLSTAELLAELTGEAVREAPELHHASLNRPLPDALIWVAEDNLVNQKVISGLLRFMGLKHRLFGDGRQICDAFADGNNLPDLILMDCEMPVMDGFDATRWLRQHGGAQSAVPVVGLSAHVLSEYQDKARAAGFDDFLNKPIDRQQLQQTLAHWLHQAELKRHSR